MFRSDGGCRVDQNPAISVVYFGTIDHDTKHSILQPLNDLFEVLGKDLAFTPTILEFLLPEPGRAGERNHVDRYLSALDSFTSSITIGITRYGLWDDVPFPRFIFASGGESNSILSLYRFIHDSSSRVSALQRIAKEIPKALALALSLPVCRLPECYLTYHWQMIDFDFNVGLCTACKMKFIEELNQTFSENRAVQT